MYICISLYITYQVLSSMGYRWAHPPCAKTPRCRRLSSWLKSLRSDANEAPGESNSTLAAKEKKKHLPAVPYVQYFFRSHQFNSFQVIIDHHSVSSRFWCETRTHTLWVKTIPYCFFTNLTVWIRRTPCMGYAFQCNCPPKTTQTWN